MNLISLDISTKTGFAIFINNKLVSYGTLWPDRNTESFNAAYPFSYILLAQHIANKIYNQVVRPAYEQAKGNCIICIEETTTSRSNLSQKILEFIHYALLQLLQGMPVYYVRTGSWRSVIGAKLTDEEKKINKQIEKYKAKTGEKLAKLDLDGSGKLKVVGKIGTKHCVLRVVNKELGLNLSLKDNDACDALGLGLAFLKGVKLCDGVIKKSKQT